MIPDTVAYAYRFVVESTRASDADALDEDAGSGSGDESSDEESAIERKRAAIQTALEAVRGLLPRIGSFEGIEVRAINDGLRTVGLTQFNAASLAGKVAKAKAKAENRKPPKSKGT